MSSDYIVNKQDLEKSGVTFENCVCEYTGDPRTTASFPGYEYLRDVWIDPDDQTDVHISCSGQFRNWLEHDFLKANCIKFEKF